MSSRVTRSPWWHVEIDGLLGAAIAALVLLGLIMMASASVTVGDGDHGMPFYYLSRQLAFLTLGAGAAAVVLLTPTAAWERAGPALLLLALALLVLVLLPGVGHTVNGATRWISFGPFNLQVSEPARVLIIVYLAGYLVRRHASVRGSFGGFLRPVLVVALVCALLLAQPDFGAAAVLLAAVTGMLFVGGVRLRDLLALTVVAGAVMLALGLSMDYRAERLTSFLDPWADPSDSGYQLIQSLISIGRGEWLGVGLGGSVQKLFYLPEAHTDFVFAVLAEELGLVGAAGTIALYALLIWRCLDIARAAGVAGMPFQAYLVWGIGIWLGVQTSVNIGVTLGVLPTKGLTLPLVSYGGSSLLAVCVALALVLRVHHEVALRSRSASVRPARPARRAKRRAANTAEAGT